ncbi:MAG: glycosyltransferase [Aquaticitalea sp.]
MKKKILVAPLNWGLGHATRCIPIINALIDTNFEPIIASDGIALALLKKEFPNVLHIELPAYDITYSKKGHFLKLKLLKDAPKVMNAMMAEKKATAQIIETYKIDGIISDNRLGVHSTHVPSVFMTHQLQVLSGNTTWLSTKMHQKIIKRFDECWVPDNVGSPNLSGELGHAIPKNIVVKHIGPLSRFKKTDCKIRYDIMVLLSGPEPQRTLLENILWEKFKNYTGTLLFVKGVIEKEQVMEQRGSITIYNYLMGTQLETALNESELIISRSGYTTIMDLATLGKKAFFIPTPGQFEQEYLAKRLMQNKNVPYCKQNDFYLEKLKIVPQYTGLDTPEYDLNYKKLFQLFKGE